MSDYRPNFVLISRNGNSPPPRKPLSATRKPKDGVSITIKFDAEKFVAEFMAKLDAMAKEAAEEMYREMKRRLDEEGLE